MIVCTNDNTPEYRASKLAVVAVSHLQHPDLAVTLIELSTRVERYAAECATLTRRANSIAVTRTLFLLEYVFME